LSVPYVSSGLVHSMSIVIDGSFLINLSNNSATVEERVLAAR
jgi:hypothetical protein